MYCSRLFVPLHKRNDYGTYQDIHKTHQHGTAFAGACGGEHAEVVGRGMYDTFYFALPQGADGRIGRSADNGYLESDGTIAGDCQAQGYRRQDDYGAGQDDARTAEAHRRLLGVDNTRGHLPAL